MTQDLAHHKICQERDAELISFDRIDEHFLVGSQSSARKGSAYWIAFVYNNTSSSFTWLRGLPAAFAKWAKYEPAYENGNCVTFGFDGVSFGWSVANCSNKAGYICKSEPNNGMIHDLYVLFSGKIEGLEGNVTAPPQSSLGCQ